MQGFKSLLGDVISNVASNRRDQQQPRSQAQTSEGYNQPSSADMNQGGYGYPGQGGYTSGNQGYPPPQNQGYGGYPPQGAGYPQPGGYPQQAAGYPPQGAGYPQQGPGYPQQGAGYPPQGPGNIGFAFAGNGAGNYPPPQPGFGPRQELGYPSHGGYPSGPQQSQPYQPYGSAPQQPRVPTYPQVSNMRPVSLPIHSVLRVTLGVSPKNSLFPAARIMPSAYACLPARPCRNALQTKELLQCRTDVRRWWPRPDSTLMQTPKRFARQ
uniref:Annexin A7 n=1 Tax=Steinernema glaseri TaxID=37863 RepID=A0A1I7ZAA3_9BILA